jgi:hypothetical protein
VVVTEFHCDSSPSDTKSPGLTQYIIATCNRIFYSLSFSATSLQPPNHLCVLHVSTSHKVTKVHRTNTLRKQPKNTDLPTYSDTVCYILCTRRPNKVGQDRSSEMKRCLLSLRVDRLTVTVIRGLPTHIKQSLPLPGQCVSSARLQPQRSAVIALFGKKESGWKCGRVLCDIDTIVDVNPVV